ncbi:hypothetical protein [Melittangium boletus]|uniref:hypothetical protein n=1 Tax=Melittangium boletus TaxID=83453 RepID=UPI003DA4C236
MRRLSLLLLSLCACQARTPATRRPPVEPPPATTAPAATSRAFTRLGGPLRPAWFVCDGTNQPRLVVVERSAEGREVTLTVLDKTPGAAPVRHTYDLGEPDAGMQQRFYPLLRNGREAAALRSLDPRALPDPSRSWIPPFLGVRLAEGPDLACRFMEGVRLLGFDGRRSVLVTQDVQGRLTYRSFDFADAGRVEDTPVEGYGHTTAPASQTVEGGTEARTLDGASSTFTFQNEGYRYVLRVGERASLEVWKGASSVQRTDLLAWTSAPPPT